MLYNYFIKWFKWLVTQIDFFVGFPLSVQIFFWVYNIVSDPYYSGMIDPGPVLDPDPT